MNDEEVEKGRKHILAYAQTVDKRITKDNVNIEYFIAGTGGDEMTNSYLT